MPNSSLNIRVQLYIRVSACVAGDDAPSENKHCVGLARASRHGMGLLYDCGDRGWTVERLCFPLSPP